VPPKRVVSRKPLTKSAGAPRPHHSHDLTKREDEVLFWLSRGKSNRDIAAILQIKPATVGKHLEHIYPKLGVENRTAAASFAFEQGSSETGSHLNI